MRSWLPLAVLLCGCPPKPPDTGDSGDTGDTGDSGDSGDTGPVIDPPDLAGCNLVEENDENADGTIDKTATYEFGKCGYIKDTWPTVTDPNIQLVETAHVVGADRADLDHRRGDGTIDKVVKWTYNAACQDTRRDDDDGADGSVNWYAAKSYDDQYRLVQEQIAPGGRVNRTNTFTYDEKGRLAERRDVDNQGPDFKTTYVYDDSDRLIREDSDEGPDGTIDRKTYYTWEGTKLVRMDVDETLGGDFETVRHFAGDANNRFTTISNDRPPDGVYEWVAVWTYDAKGRPLMAETLVDAEVDGRITWKWSCPD